jgi:hypothetical protein
MSGRDLIMGRMLPDGRASWYEPVRPGQKMAPIWKRNTHVVEKPDDIVAIMGGRATRPNEPITLIGPDGMPIAIVGLGQTETAEIADLVQQQQEKQPINWDVKRDQMGLMPRDRAGDEISQAIERRMDQHKRNWRTDPAKELRDGN